MGEDMDIVVGVQVEADGAKLQQQLDGIKPRPNVKVGVELDTAANQTIAEQMRKVSPFTSHVKPSVNQSEFEQAVKSVIQRIQKTKMPSVHIRAELDSESLQTIRASLQEMVNDLAKSVPAVNLSKALFGGAGGTADMQAQADQTTKAVNQVTQTLQGLSKVNYDVSGGSDELKKQLLQFGLSKDDVDAVVKQIESGGFKIAQARARFAQMMVNGEDGKKTLSEDELLQSVSISGKTSEGVSAVRTLTRNAQGDFAMSTQLGMTLDEQGKVIQSADQATKQQEKINKLLAKLNELEAQAFNRSQPIKGNDAAILQSTIQQIRGDLNADGADLTDIDAQIQKLQTTIKNMKSAQKAVNELGSISVADKYQRTQSSMQTMEQNMNTLAGSLNADGLVEEANKIQVAFSIMESAFQNVGDKGDNAVASDWSEYTKAAKDYQEAVTQATNAQKRFNEEQTAVKKADTTVTNLKNVGMTAEADALEKAMQRVQTASQKLKESTDSADLQEYASAMKSLTTVTDEYNQRLSKSVKQQNLNDQLEKQRQAIAKVRNEWSKAMSNSANANWLSQIEEDLNSAARAGDKISFDKAKRQFQNFQATMKATGQATETFASKVKRLASEFTQWFSISQVIMKVVQGFKTMKTTVTEVDTAMANLKKVTDGTAASYDAFTSRAIAQAKNLKTSVTDVIDATAGWSRLGYNDMADAEALGKWSIVYANVGDDVENVEAATSSLISTLKGFGNEGNTTVEQVERIVDIFNKLGNNTSISSGQLGESLQNSAAALSEANNTLAESAALTVGAYDVLQNASEVGNMWKTVAMRIRGAKTELEAAGEDTEGMAESTSKLREQVKAMTGFDIMANANEFKSTYDIIVGIGEVWDDLTDIDQASLLELLAGKNRGNALAAALNNVDAIKNAYEMASDSAGSATKEYEVYESTVEAHAKRMEASVQAFSESMLSTDVLNAGYDAISGLLDLLTKVSDTLGSLPTLITAAATAFTLFTGKGRSIVIYAPPREHPSAA